MKHFKSKPLEQSLVALDRLFNAYQNSTIPHYKMSRIVVDEVAQYHVVNLSTNVTHSEWKDMDTALRVMRDLNRMAKRSA